MVERSKFRRRWLKWFIAAAVMTTLAAAGYFTQPEFAKMSTGRLLPQVAVGCAMLFCGWLGLFAVVQLAISAVRSLLRKNSNSSDTNAQP